LKRTLKLAVGILVSVACVWFSMRDVRLIEVWRALKQANYIGFAAVMASTLIGFWIRAVRWGSLIHEPRPIRQASLFGATMIGFMANNVLPLRLGEFIRPWALARREKLSRSTLFATVVVERAIDMVTLLVIFGISLLVHPISSETEAGRMTQAGATVLVIACAALTVFVVALERSEKLARAVIDRLSAPLPPHLRGRAGRALESFVKGLGVFRDLPRVLWVFALSFVMFGVIVLGLAAGMWALGIEVPWYAGLVMLVITAIGIMVPAAPGYIGTMNLACIAGLAIFGVGKDLAVPFSWFYWAGQWLPVTLLGFYYLQREGLSLRSIGRMQEGSA
jgi:uncharacterized protein (TIRG00374 family)